MRHLLLLVLGCLFSVQVFAFGATTNAINDIATSGSTAGTSGSAASTDTSKRDKIIEQAQNDAAAFVGSNGKIRGVYLEVALQHLRQHYHVANHIADLTLAEAILTY
ncbi:DUF2388 domain-containing protein [Entomomonas asaccharolytica]|uniref:DUF2388 domain-containing protein n=1 Tax=Entomomonas asaccharolytica TaxID=2785331 RepID=A0A974RW95_9GAMM|nr:DUF2388 domain-containing protein [Entomomonas asaccharolytica]QQP84981.1 DUF2388 domain-containing protein [Entomomonas asaccharolytica]